MSEIRESPENTILNKSTISGLISWGNRILQQHGIDSSRLDAEIILSHLLGCKRIDLYLHPDKPVGNTISVNYKKGIQKRAMHMPVQYITNHAEFMSMDFSVDERVLIPRPETEFLVEAVIRKSQLLSKEQEITIVDIGAGSGNISITLVKHIGNARIFATDISPDALEVAKANARKHQAHGKILFLCGDLYKPLEKCKLESGVDFIVSNPPYVSHSEFDALQEEVRCYEPYGALVSSQYGLQLFKRIISNAHVWLKPGGFLTFEVGEKQAQKVAHLIEDTGYFKKSELIKDYQQIYRIVISQKKEEITQRPVVSLSNI
ncbi:MAG: peptide chain release factor N(5)-glutamine methyltransferase [Candidatus Loosdrechtia sp.]|uniref:N5-glutamine methyltransferase family protein n=1 Tax=Candidatus Loosdrechtia sp. TaxID=3101272 RepID=UPI003A72C79D|nr:MAG: peptide chain release factor N(5)-glutamine methyltransferase [Candidatus Jettenia sp. AMX2]